MRRPFKGEVPHPGVLGQRRKDYLIGANQEGIHAEALSSSDPPGFVARFMRLRKEGSAIVRLRVS